MVIRFYLDNYENRHGLRKVLCELKQSGWIVRIKTGIYARPENWNQTRQQLRPGHPNQQTGNALLTRIRTDLERLWLTEIAEGREPFPETVKEKYLALRSGSGNFWERLESYRDGKDKKATRDAYGYLEKDLKSYQDSIKRRIDFSAMTIETFTGFASWMKAQGYRRNSIALRLATLRAFLRMGHASGWHNNDSYIHIRVDREKSPQVVLTPEEVEAIQAAPLPDDLAQVRDVFVFQIYSGLRASDLRRAEVRGDVLMLRTKKSDTPLTLTINEKAVEIWNRYEGVLPVPLMPIYNAHIKEVCREAGVKGVVHYRGRQVEKWKAVGSHTARRTCAALLYGKGVGLKQISLILGHATVATTETYLRHLAPGGDLSGL